MSMLFRCDICQKEVKTFWNISITRKRISPAGVQETRTENYDVCSTKCETEGAAMLLAVIMPHIDSVDLPITPKEKSQS